MKTKEPKFKNGDILIQESSCENEYFIFQIRFKRKQYYYLKYLHHEHRDFGRINISTVDYGNIMLYPAELLTDEEKIELL